MEQLWLARLISDTPPLSPPPEGLYGYDDLEKQNDAYDGGFPVRANEAEAADDAYVSPLPPPYLPCRCWRTILNCIRRPRV